MLLSTTSVFTVEDSHRITSVVCLGGGGSREREGVVKSVQKWKVWEYFPGAETPEAVNTHVIRLT